MSVCVQAPGGCWHWTYCLRLWAYLYSGYKEPEFGLLTTCSLAIEAGHGPVGPVLMQSTLGCLGSKVTWLDLPRLFACLSVVLGPSVYMIVLFQDLDFFLKKSHACLHRVKAPHLGALQCYTPWAIALSAQHCVMPPCRVLILYLKYSTMCTITCFVELVVSQRSWILPYKNDLPTMFFNVEVLKQGFLQNRYRVT